MKLEDINKLSVLTESEAIEIFKSIKLTHRIQQYRLNDHRIMACVEETNVLQDDDIKDYDNEPYAIYFFIRGKFGKQLVNF